MTDSEVKEYFNHLEKFTIRKLPKEIREYVVTRYSDSKSIQESCYRIINDMEIRPSCIVCGGHVHFCTKPSRIGFSKCCSRKCLLSLPETKEKIKNSLITNYGKDYRKTISDKRKQTCIEKYGVPYSFQAECVKEKIKNTSLERYGVDNPAKSTISKEKQHNIYVKNKDKIVQHAKDTCLKRYGVDNPMKSEEIRNRAKQTCLDRYGVDNPMKSEEIQNKVKHTCIEKYDVENYSQTSEYKNKIIKTSLEKYGATNYKSTMESKLHMSTILSSIEVQTKRNNTLKQNNTYNSSKTEDLIYNLLIEKYPDTIRQYSSKEYPFSCDFYIPSKNLYIECNFHWTHGGHLYDASSDEDNIVVDKWKNKHTKYYDNAIYTWTILDVKKSSTAKANNLNYKIFYKFKDFDITKL